MRCVGLNGINWAATKADILDRSIFFKLKRIPDKERKYIVKIQKEFELMKPQLLGYIFDILVKVKKWKEVNGDLDVEKIPRMADWRELRNNFTGDGIEVVKTYGSGSRAFARYSSAVDSMVAVCVHGCRDAGRSA